MTTLGFKSFSKGTIHNPFYEQHNKHKERMMLSVPLRLRLIKDVMLIKGISVHESINMRVSIHKSIDDTIKVIRAKEISHAFYSLFH